MDIDITKIQYYLAPATAPIPTAIAVGATLNHAIGSIPGIWPSLAMVGGIGGAIATEVSGGLMFSMAARAFLKKKWTALLVALLGSVGYVVVVAYSVSVSKDAAPVMASVVISALVYIAVSLYQYFRDMDNGEIVRQERQDKIAKEQLDNKIMLMEKEAEISRIRAETEKIRLDAEAERVRQEKLLELARTRTAKASSGQADVSGGQRRTAADRRPSLDPEKLARVRKYLQAHPDASVRDIAGANLGIQKSAAANYKSAVLAEGKRER